MIFLLVLLCTVAQGAWAVSYITDVMVIGCETESGIDAKWSYYQQQGWSRFEQNLNNNAAGGYYVYLLYKMNESGDGINDFYFRVAEDDDAPSSFTYLDRTYHLVQSDGDKAFRQSFGDLNVGTGSKYAIQLYYAKEANSTIVINSITFDDISSDAVCENDGTTPCNLNKGTAGDAIYMHVSKIHSDLYATVYNESDLVAAAAQNNKIITLGADIALSDYLDIAGGLTITLDLNGHTLSRNPSAHSDMGSVIRVEKGGTLTVKDSSGDNSGVISGGRATNGGGINNHGTLTFEGGTITDCSATNGGAIFNAPNVQGGTPATMTMTGGVIDGCWATDCGGIYNYAGCTLTISGGTIQNCSSDGGGGGVVNYGTATISGGTFTGNHATTRGGAVWNGSSATMTITGGTFTGNRADLYGGGVFSYSSFNMGGNPVITGNTVNGNRNNLYLDNNAVINVTGAFTEGAKVGVTLANTNRVFTSGYSTHHSGTDPSSIFTPDNTDTYLSSNDDGEVKLNQTQGNWIDYRSKDFSYAETYMVRPIVHIQNEAELAYLAYLINRGENLYAGTTYEKKMGEVVLERDLDMSAHFWTPIGNNEHMFDIKFNGKGHTIKGIRVNSTGEGNGLFGCVLGTYNVGQGDVKCCEYIKNFTLKDSYIKGGNRTGGVVGYIHHKTTFENVFCQADVTGNDCVGGLVGFAEGSQYSAPHWYYDPAEYRPNIKNNLYLSGKVTATGDCGAVVGKIGAFVYCYDSYYVDPASKVGNGYNERAYPVRKSVPAGVTVSYQTSGIVYNDTYYHPAGTVVNFTVKNGFNLLVEKVMVNGTEVTVSNDKYTFTIDPETAEAYEISVTTGPSPIKGSGTEGDPYLIEDADDWNYIADYLNSGQVSNDFNGVYFKLAAADMTISQMMGNESHPFKGIFDGDGHTLTLAFGSAGNFLDQECAPFGFIENATIKNLTTAGSIYSSAKFNAGLAVRAKGNDNHIRNYVSSVSINSNRDGDCTNAGFVGILDINDTKVYFEGCAFVGELLGANACNWGGFIGWRVFENKNHNEVNFTDCFFAPKTVSIAIPGGSNSRTFCRSNANTTNGATYTRCYYTEVLQVAEGGTQVYSTTSLPAYIGEEVTDYGFIKAYAKGLKVGDLYYMTLETINFADNEDNSNAISETDGYFANVTLTDRTLYADGNWNTLCLPFGVNALDGTPLQGATVMELDVEGKYSGHQTGFDRGNGTLYLYFKEATAIEAGKPYLVKWKNDKPADVSISSTDDWNTFASNVNDGKDSYVGKVVKLNSDIDISTMVGTEDYPFKGTFDGAGHTLNVTLRDNVYGMAPFHYISGATIQNVKTRGTVTAHNHCTGLVGFASGGTNTIQNCHVAVDVYSPRKYVGGILGHGMSSITTVTDCLFTGSLYCDFGACIGVFDAWNDEGTHSVVNCLAAGSYSETPRIAFRNNGAKNCYSKSGSLEDAADASAMSNEELLAALGTGWEIVGDNVVPKKVPTSITNPIFTKVTISKETSDVTSDDWSVTFKGTYDPVAIGDEGDNTKLYFGNGNTLYWPNGAMTINPFRAYFQLNTINAKARSIVLNFGEGDMTTVISDATRLNDKEQMINDNWYTLDGRKMQGKPAQKGVYIKNGHKVVIK